MNYIPQNRPERILMGKHSYGSCQALTYTPAEPSGVEIGNFVSIAHGVRFLLDGEHRKDCVSQSPMTNFDIGPENHGLGKGPIIIGHDAWIGMEATILSGVRIGIGAVVGACSVVASDVDPYTIVAGNPAQLIGRRHAGYEDRLLASEWWDWEDSRIAEALPLLLSDDVEGFLEFANKM